MVYYRTNLAHEKGVRMINILYLLADYFSQKPKKIVTVLTDGNDLFSVFPSGIIHAHTPFLPKLRHAFGMQVENEFGHLVHGFSGIPVKNPRVGQDIFLATGGRPVVSLKQKVLRVFPNPVRFSIDDLLDIIIHLEPSGQLEMIPGTYPDNIIYNVAMNELLERFLAAKEWRLKLDDEMWGFIKHHTIFTILISARYIEISERHVIANSVFKILTMEALHRRYPMRTEFDKNGILHLVD